MKEEKRLENQLLNEIPTILPSEKMDGANLKTVIESIGDSAVLGHHQVKVTVDKDENADYSQIKFCTVNNKKCAPAKNSHIKLSLSEIIYPSAPEGMIYVSARSCLLAENISEGGSACGEWSKKKYKNPKTPDYIKKVVGPMLQDIFLAGIERQALCDEMHKKFIAYKKTISSSDETDSAKVFNKIINNKINLGPQFCVSDLSDLEFQLEVEDKEGDIKKQQGEDSGESEGTNNSGDSSDSNLGDSSDSNSGTKKRTYYFKVTEYRKLNSLNQMYLKLALKQMMQELIE